MTEQTVNYQTLNSVQDYGNLEPQTRSIVPVHDPENGRFVCEYDRDRHALIWYNRSRRTVIPLPPCRKVQE